MKVLVLAFALASTFGHTQTTTIPSGTRTSHLAAPFRIDWDVRIPMRDDVKLCATVFLPANQQEPLPIILAMTPYTLSFTAEWGRFFAQNGYVFVSVDMRGRGDSEGSHIPMVRDPQDGYDTVEWLARQSWCNGKVGMTGLSYLGGTQWATAKLRPPHLATIIPIASTHPGVDVPTLGGIHFVDTMGLVLRTSGRSRKGAGFGGDEYVDGTAHDFFRSGWPWRELDRFFGLPSPVFQAWMRHPAHDAYWKAATPAAEDYRKLDIPILTITGHYDDDQVGAMTYYRDNMHHGSPAAKDRHFLVIGPWDPMQTRTPALGSQGPLRPRGPDLAPTPPPTPADTPLTRAALGYFTTNCGTCHRATAQGSTLGAVDLAFNHLAAATSAAAEPGWATTVGRAGKYTLPGEAPGGTRRVVPGDPERSALLYRMASRRPASQMPPLGTVLADEAALALMRKWIAEETR